MAIRKDRRIDLTINSVRASLLDLLEVMPINRISISQLCRHADINRNTFYNYFNSPQDVLEDLENEMLNDFTSSIKNATDMFGVILKACECMEYHKKISTLIFLRTDMNRIIEKSFVIAQQLPWSLKKIEKQSGASTNSLYIYNFSKNGILAIIKQWVLGGFIESSTDIAHLLTTLVQSTRKVALEKYQHQTFDKVWYKGASCHFRPLEERVNDREQEIRNRLSLVMLKGAGMFEV